MDDAGVDGVTAMLSVRTRQNLPLGMLASRRELVDFR